MHGLTKTGQFTLVEDTVKTGAVSLVERWMEIGGHEFLPLDELQKSRVFLPGLCLSK